MNARVLTTFRFYQLFRGVDFAGAIWVPFLLERGFSLPQVGLIEAVLHVGMLGAQIPTGALADTLGRRRAPHSTRRPAPAHTPTRAARPR